jgi:AcrR family transcriptional regulator
MSDTKRVRMTGQERREQLVGVARSVFAERGYEAATVEEIAERAGVSKPVVYEHFGGKEGVYAVVVDREIRALTEGIVAALRNPRPRAGAEQAAESFLRFIEEREEGFRILVRDAPVGTGRGSYASVLAEVATRAEELLASVFEARGYDPATAPMYARMLVGAVALLGEWWVEEREPPREQVAAHVVNLMWHGLGDLRVVE